MLNSERRRMSDNDFAYVGAEGICTVDLQAKN